MRLFVRLAFAAALAALPAGLTAVSCGTDAVGVATCRAIEAARCNAAPACRSGFDVDRCLRTYRDECLVGLQNPSPDAGDPSLAQPCVDAINAASACASGSASCGALALVPDASCTTSALDPTACNIILYCPEALAACAFIAAPPGASDAGDAGNASDASDAADGE